METEKKDNRKLLRIYIRPDTEQEITEWCENQQNVSISIKTLIRMAIAVKGTRDVLTLPFGENALVQTEAERPAKQESRGGEPSKSSAPKKAEEKGSLNDIRSAYYGITDKDDSDSDDMDVFGAL